MTRQKKLTKSSTRKKATTKPRKRGKKLDANAINIILLKEIIDHLYTMIDRLSPKGKGFAD